MLVEQNPNAGMLTPMGASIAEALGAVTAEGFGPNGIPSDLSADEVMNGPGTATWPTPPKARSPTVSRHGGRHHRRGRCQRITSPATVQPRALSDTRDGQLAFGHPAACGAALGVVPAAAPR